MSAAVAAALRQYATFSGRASRSEFWWWYLALFLVATVFAVGAYALGTGTVGTILVVAYTLFFLATVVPTLAVGARRLRDAGLSPWFLLLYLLPIANLALLVLFALPSRPAFAR